MLPNQQKERRIPDRENARGPLAKAPNVVGIGNHGAPGTRQHPRTAAHPLTKEAVSGQWNTIEELRVQQTESAVRGAQMGQLMARDATCIKDTIHT